MSGPLADHVLAHAPKGLDLRTRAVYAVLALRSDHHGNGANRSVDEIAELLAMKPETVRSRLDVLDKRGLVPVEAKGGPGRGRITQRRIVVRWCPDGRRPDGRECVLCRILAEQQDQQDRKERGPQGTLSPTRPAERKGSPRDEKRVPPGREKGPPGDPPTYYVETAPRRGGAVSHPESSDAPAPSQSSGASLEPGQQERQEQERRAAKLAERADVQALLDGGPPPTLDSRDQALWRLRVEQRRDRIDQWLANHPAAGS